MEIEIDPVITDVLEEVGEKVATGLGGMLGCELILPAPETNIVSKNEFFKSTRKKQVMVRMTASGDRQGEIYVFSRLKDAVQLGGILIMLPPGELEDRVKKETFGEEESDSFGEIANIISGELCSAFDELYPEKIHFKMADMEAIVPSKVKPDTPEPFPPGHYLKASYSGTLDGQALDDLILLFPAAMFGIEIPEAEAPPEPVATSDRAASAAVGRLVDPDEAADLLRDGAVKGELKAGVAVETAPKGGSVQAGQSLDGDELGSQAAEPVEAVILVVAIDGSSGQVISTVMNEHGHKAKLVDRKENFTDLSHALAGRVRGLVLAMDEIDDQGFSVAIKVRTAFGESVPLMATGSQWTRSKVLQAVKYGVCDILVIPATTEEVLEKVQTHFKAPHGIAV